MSEIKINSGDLEILYSGSFLANANKEIRFELNCNNDILSLVIVFNNLDKAKGLTSHGEVIDPQTLKLTLFNHVNTLGSNTKYPLLLGTISDRELYWMYRVCLLSEGDESKGFASVLELTYTFYLGKEVK